MAIAASATAFATYEFNYDLFTLEEFESAVGDIGDFVPGAGDTSALQPYGGGEQPEILDPEYAEASSYGDRYLSLNTGDSTLWSGACSPGGNVYIDTFVQLGDLGSAPTSFESGIKTALWVAGGKLYIRAYDSVGSTNANYMLSGTYEDDAWYRLTVSSLTNGTGTVQFQVRVNGGNPLTLADDSNVNTFDALTSGQVTQVGFKGTGAIDNFGIASKYPMPNAMEHFFASGSGTEADPYIVTDADAFAAAVAGEYVSVDGVYFRLTDNVQIGTVSALPAGAVCYVAVDSGSSFDGFSGAFEVPQSGGYKTYQANLFPRTVTAGQNGSAEHPYEIADVDDLQALQLALDVTNIYNACCFVQTADIDMSSAGAFAGIGTYNTAGGGNPATGGVSFCGTYDGQGCKISNVTFTDRDYAGIFNQVNGGTVQNLTVENVTFVGTGSKYCGAIIGNAGNGATLKNLVAAGSFGSAEKPGNHNMAGIAIRLSGGGTGTLVQNCTNNAAIYGTYTKLAGICTLTQVKESGGAVTFDGCVNNGALTMPSGGTAGRDGLAGIVGYASDATVLVNCSNTGAISSTLASAKVGELVGYSYAGYTLTDQGGNSGDATKKLVGYQDGTINGFKYAMVDNGVATTVTTLEEGNTYLLEGNVAASETPVYEFTEAGTIAFDTALGYSFAGTVDADPNYANVISVTDATSGSVTTYTATMAPVVATVGDAKFATLQAAITAADEGATKTVTLVGAASGAVNIPEGVVVQLDTANFLNNENVTTLSGSGRIVFNGSGATGISAKVKQTTWAGTLEVRNFGYTRDYCYLSWFGNENSTVCFSNCGIKPAPDYNGIKAVEVGSGGLDFEGTEDAATTFTLPCALTGTGKIKVKVGGTNLSKILITGDASAFAGSIEILTTANCSLDFRASCSSGKNQIGVASGTSVTVAAGKTWASSDFIFNGSVTLNGALVDADDSSVGKVWNNVAGAVLTVNAANAFKFGNTTSWVGTYNVNYDNASAGDEFVMPQNANAMIVINGVNGSFKGYPTRGSAYAPTVAGSLTLNADWTIANGWSSTDSDYITTFAKLSGSGDLTVNGTGSGSTPIYYTITELDGYTGTIGGARGAFTVGKVNVTTLPASGTRVVKTAIGANGSINDNVPLYVAGTNSGKTLTYNASGAEGAGLYYVADAAVIDPATGKVSADTAQEAADAPIEVSSAVATALATASVTEEAYQAYFTKSDPVYNEATGKYEVTATIAETVETGVAESAIAALTDDTADTITVPAGLYYRITPSGDLSTWGTGAAVKSGLSNGSAISVTEPGTTEKGFFRVELSATPFN
jgi:hypothetical protein